jgi:hypothetical protein
LSFLAHATTAKAAADSAASLNLDATIVLPPPKGREKNCSHHQYGAGRFGGGTGQKPYALPALPTTLDGLPGRKARLVEDVRARKARETALYIECEGAEPVGRRNREGTFANSMIAKSSPLGSIPPKPRTDLIP